jgi:acyl-coenzyme A thioesterase PaaI-like protein
MVNPDRTRLVLLVPWVADQHERLTPTCLVAPDGETTCGLPATVRITVTPAQGGVAGPVTFACADHAPAFAHHPAVTAIREVHRHDS